MNINGFYPTSDYQSAIVVPCYREAKRLDTKKYIESLKDFSSKVIFVDDGSPDETFSIIKGLEKSYPDRFIAIKNPENMGKAGAVRNGMLKGIQENFKKIGFLDADLAVSLKETEGFLNVFNDFPDVNTVIGVRTRLAGHKIDRSLAKYLAQRVIAGMGGVLFDKSITDSQCGAKVFKADVLKKTLKEKFNVKWIFDQELLTRISRLPESIGKEWLFEYPVAKWEEIGSSHVKPKDYIKSLKDYFKLLKIYKLKI